VEWPQRLPGVTGLSHRLVERADDEQSAPFGAFGKEARARRRPGLRRFLGSKGLYLEVKGGKMRLKEHEIASIKRCAERHFGPNCAVRLFGSRADDGPARR
jgi:hypothetical protein